MKSYKIVYSVPVHEKPEVIIDQAINVTHFNPECAVVFHISKGFVEEASMSLEVLYEKLAGIPGVYVNPTRNDTAWGNIIKAHLSNFEYAREVCDFEYFAIAASNELFYKSGAYEFVKEYDIVVQQLSAIHERDVWDNAKYALEDKDLKEMLTEAGVDAEATNELTLGGQCEGSFYRKHIYEKIVEYVNKYYDFSNEPEVVYSREEIYPPTLANALFPDAKSLNANTCLVFWGKRALRAYIKDIKHSYKVLDNHYSLKRCDRDLYEPKRSYVRQVLGDYLYQEQELINVHNDSKCQIKDWLQYIHYLTSIIGK